jgi:CheY-like chemotaxis protein
MEKALQLSINMAPELDQYSLLGDPFRLGQILLNLTGNAVKFTEIGSINVNINIIEEQTDAVLLRFEVEDTGIGIATEDIQRLFTVFEQADSSMTRKYGGTGLGLVISKRLVQLMGGEIGLTSQPGHGSRFWFTTRLPKSQRKAIQTMIIKDSSETRLKAQCSGVRILLVEDEPINQEVSCWLLQEVGLIVDLAEDGAQAVEMARQNRYALILMDMQLPVMNGIEATRIIRTLEGYANIPILAMTANAFTEDRQACVEAGMNDHIGKPVVPESLYDTLLHWLTKVGS